MSWSKLIAVKKPNSDGTELQLAKLGFSDYEFNKLINNREIFNSARNDSIWVFEFDTYNLFWNVYLPIEEQKEISKKLKGYKIVSMFNSTSVNGYYICITEDGNIIRMRSGSSDSEESTIGEEFYEEKSSYLEKRKSDGVTYYQWKIKRIPEELSEVVWYSHDQVGESLCKEILRAYLEVRSGIRIPDEEKANKISVYINRTRLDDYHSRINLLRWYWKTGQKNLIILKSNGRTKVR